MVKPGPQLLFRGRCLNLLLHAAAFIGQFDYKFCHSSLRRFGTDCCAGPCFDGALLLKGISLTRTIDER
jgi:hypothetical protein